MPKTEEKVLITGNVAAAEGAVRGGCRFYFGYPITPQNDLPEYMPARMPEAGGEGATDSLIGPGTRIGKGSR